MSISLVVADDHTVVREGLKSLLEDSDIEVVGEAANGLEALKVAKKLRPDVVLMDIRMPEQDGLDALESLHREVPNTHVVMLSTHDNPTYIARSVALGAKNYMLKATTGRDELISAIASAVNEPEGETSNEMKKVAGAMNTRKRSGDDDMPLTNRESQVLRHVALGLSNKEIGQSLSISVETVKEHVQNILRKIAVTDRTQAAVWAVRRGLV